MAGVDELQLPCPPLGAWLPERLGRGGVRVVVRTRIPRSARTFLDRWPPLTPGERQLSGLVVLDELGAPAAAGVELEQVLVPGGLVVELVAVRGRLVGQLLGLGERASQRREEAARRVIDWAQAGLWGLEQWVSVDPPDLVVTLGRTRGITSSEAP